MVVALQRYDKSRLYYDSDLHMINITNLGKPVTNENEVGMILPLMSPIFMIVDKEMYFSLSNNTLAMWYGDMFIMRSLTLDLGYIYMDGALDFLTRFETISTKDGMGMTWGELIRGLV